jgi:hypothetical protein
LPQKLQSSCSLPSLARAIPFSFYSDFPFTARGNCQWCSMTRSMIPYSLAS